MKILNLNPWVADESLIKYEQELLPDDVEVSGLNEKLFQECHNDLDYTFPATIDAIVDAEKQGYDAVVIACFGDTGVEEGRSLVDIPVLGPTNVAFHVAAMIGHRICLLLPEYKRVKVPTRQNIIAYGFQDKVVVRGGSFTVPESIKAYEEYKVSKKISPFIAEMREISIKSIEEDDVDVIVLGCGGIMWMKEVLESEIEKKGYGITVINPLTVANEVARALVNLNINHSRQAYPREKNKR